MADGQYSAFSIHIENTVLAASKLVGWGLRTFGGRGRAVMLTLLKSLVQPKLDYCSQLWSPSDQASINKLEMVQKHLVDKIKCGKLEGLNYWDKLSNLRLYSQERRRERYQLIFLWKISQASNPSRGWDQDPKALVRFTEITLNTYYIFRQFRPVHFNETTGYQNNFIYSNSLQSR